MEKKNKKKTPISSLWLTHTCRHCECTQTPTAWIPASRLLFSLSRHLSLRHWEIFVRLMMTKHCYYILEISHPALFTDRCHGFFGLCTLNCQHLVKHTRNLAEVLPILSVQLISAKERRLENVVAVPLEI